MQQPKKIFTRMCLNNWGGINHKVLEFHESVNLFSGKSGSGKSTVMDAIQVILYGSFHSSFLNKAADDAKNRRSVLSYLRGEQKDGSANREGQDFCSTLVLEITDIGTHTAACVGLSFEVRKTDTEIRKFQFFSHSGKLPEDEYLTAGGFPYGNTAIRKLTEERARSKDNRQKGDINRIYPSKEAYLNTLYNVILGYIDENRFMTMQKSAIALKMTNGTGQFIRDYMFPKSEADTIGKISEQLGAYQEIGEKIEDLKKRIHLLTQIRETNEEMLAAKTAELKAQALIRCLEIQDLEDHLEAERQDLEAVETSRGKLEGRIAELETEREQTEQELIQVLSDLKSSDLGARQEKLKLLQETGAHLAHDSEQWRGILTGLNAWERNEEVSDYISNPLLNLLAEFGKGAVKASDCKTLRDRLAEEKADIDQAYEEYNDRRKEALAALKEKQQLVDDIKNNRKTYPEHLKKAAQLLETKLGRRVGRAVKVSVFADLFDVRDEEWKNAVEGRMGRLKFALITEPDLAHDAAVVFRELKQFEEVDLINSKAIMESNPRVSEHALYEAVETGEGYVDCCLRQYLGRIIKCRSVEELEQVRDGVTPDCYSYSGFVFRHLKERDYTVRACIGRKVSRAKLAQYEAELSKLQEKYTELAKITSSLKEAEGYERLKGDPDYYARLSGAGKELQACLKESAALEETIRILKEGKYKELEQKAAALELQKKELIDRQDKYRLQKSTLDEQFGTLVDAITKNQKALEEKQLGYTPNEVIKQEVKERLRVKSGQTVKNEETAHAAAAQAQAEAAAENRQKFRNDYLRIYPTSGFSGLEKSNELYDKLLNQYETDYEPKYQQEFEKQCERIYHSLRDNVLASIHGEIKAARRHAYEINRLLRETNFSDSTYQLKIEPAKNENGQFYDMLMAEELDSKTTDNGGYDGQMSFGEDSFLEKYQQKIDLLTEKFMPLKAGADERQKEQKRREMEQYADYRNYLSFTMYEQVTDASGNVIRENYVDEMAGRDSGGEGQNPKYVALLAGFAMLYKQQSSRDSKIQLVLLDEAFSKMDQERSAVCLKYARRMNLQLIVCVPDERLQSLIRNVDAVYGFRRYQNQISMMHIDKGNYLKMMDGDASEDIEKNG